MSSALRAARPNAPTIWSWRSLPGSASSAMVRRASATLAWVSSRCSGAQNSVADVSSCDGICLVVWRIVRMTVEWGSVASEASSRSTKSRAGISPSRTISQNAPMTSDRGRLSAKSAVCASNVAYERSSKRSFA